MPRKEAAEETVPGDTLILDFYLPELRENKFPLFKPHSLWLFFFFFNGNPSKYSGPD